MSHFSWAEDNIVFPFSLLSLFTGSDHTIKESGMEEFVSSFALLKMGRQLYSLLTQRKVFWDFQTQLELFRRFSAKGC